MTKNDYMKTLAYNLRRLPKEDYDQAMDYFEEYFADAGQENEQHAIQDLGSPEEAARELIQNLAAKNVEEPPVTVKRSFKAVWIGILGVCAAPIALPLAFGLIILIAALILTLLCLAGSLFLAAVCVVGSSLVGIFGGVVLLFKSFADGLATLGFSIFFTGVGVLFVYVTFCLCKWVLRKTAQALGKITKRGQKA